MRNLHENSKGGSKQRKIGGIQRDCSAGKEGYADRMRKGGGERALNYVNNKREMEITKFVLLKIIAAKILNKHALE